MVQRKPLKANTCWTSLFVNLAVNYFLLISVVILQGRDCSCHHYVSPDFYEHTEHLGVLLECRLQFSPMGWSLASAFLMSSQVTLMLKPRDHTLRQPQTASQSWQQKREWLSSRLQQQLEYILKGSCIEVVHEAVSTPYSSTGRLTCNF